MGLPSHEGLAGQCAVSTACDLLAGKDDHGQGKRRGRSRDGCGSPYVAGAAKVLAEELELAGEVRARDRVEALYRGPVAVVVRFLHGNGEGGCGATGQGAGDQKHVHGAVRKLEVHGRTGHARSGSGHRSDGRCAHALVFQVSDECCWHS